MLRTIIIIAWILGSTELISAQEQVSATKWGIDINFGTPAGLNPGEKAPEFSGIDTQGNKISLYAELKKGAVVLIFYRGEWCPVCNRYLSNFQDSLSYVLATGAKVLAITPEKQSSALIMKEKVAATFTIISDPTEEIMKSYKVMFNVTDAYEKKIINALEADIAYNNSKEEANLPVPATFIINQQGIIVYRQFDLDYHIRASIKDILDNLPK